MNKRSHAPQYIGISVITAMLLIGAYVLIIHNKPQPLSVAAVSTPTPLAVSSETATPTASATAVETTAATATATPTASTQYKNGTYTASASYMVPRGGMNSLTIKMTIQNDTITSVTTNNDISEGDSQFYVDSFDQNISGVVVGKKLANAYVGRVGAASLTSSAFNNIVNKVMSSAKS